MTPFQQVIALYDQFPTGATIGEDLADYLSTGYVISTPKIFVMGKPVCYASAGDPDCWFIYAYAGRVKTVLDFIPYPLRYVSFQRRGKGVKTYEFNAIVRRIRQQG